MVASPIRRVRTDHEKYSNEFDCRDCRGRGDGCSGRVAADMPMVYKAAPVVVEQFGGWYLRGDIGMTNQQVKSIDNVLLAYASGAGGRSAGVRQPECCRCRRGYKFNELVPRRRDRREYRGKTAFRGLDVYPNGTNDYYRHQVGMAVHGQCLSRSRHLVVRDALRRRRYRRYSRNTIDNFRDVGVGPVNIPTLAYANANTQWEMAWASARGSRLQGHRTSPLNWLIATSISATSSPAT